jgi:hypothetical protein
MSVVSRGFVVQYFFSSLLPRRGLVCSYSLLELVQVYLQDAIVTKSVGDPNYQDACV